MPRLASVVDSPSDRFDAALSHADDLVAFIAEFAEAKHLAEEGRCDYWRALQEMALAVRDDLETMESCERQEANALHDLQNTPRRARAVKRARKASVPRG